MTDSAGSSEARQIEPDVVAELHARHADELRAYLLGLLRNRELAAEVVQSAFVKVAAQGHTVRADTLKAWLFQVAHNEAVDRLRRAATENRALQQVAWWKQPGVATPEEIAGRAEVIEHVRQAIERLPAEQREVIEQRIYDEKTFADIAAASEIPLGTVLTRMRLATKKLADALRSSFDT